LDGCSFRAADLDDAVSRRRERHLGDGGCNVVRRDGLEQDGRGGGPADEAGAVYATEASGSTHCPDRTFVGDRRRSDARHNVRLEREPRRASEVIVKGRLTMNGGIAWRWRAVAIMVAASLPILDTR
jgi:hypothetical protein